MKKTLLSLGIVLPVFAHANLDIEQHCEGETLEDAKRSCFETAIEKTVGQVIVVDRKATGNKITKYNVAQYSAGYINDYEIIDQQRDGFGWWRLKMLISISSSKIADRKLPVPISEDTFDAKKELDVLSSKWEQRLKGDQLLATVLADYPQNAYIVNSGNKEITVDNLRSTVFKIPYRIKMNQNWVKAIDEALELVSVDSGNCSTLSISRSSLKKYFCPSEPDMTVFTDGGFMPTSTGYYLPDRPTLELINSELRPNQLGQQHIGLRVDMLDQKGQVFDSRCAKINNELFIHYANPRGTYNLNDKQEISRPYVMGQNEVYGVLNLHIKDHYQLKNLAKVRLEVQDTCY